MVGSIKYYNREKGYGFVRCESGVDAFFHISDISGLNDGDYPVLGQKLSFDVIETPKGFHAVRASIVAVV